MERRKRVITDAELVSRGRVIRSDPERYVREGRSRRFEVKSARSSEGTIRGTRFRTG